MDPIDLINSGYDGATINENALVGNASNILTGTNPPFLLSDFYMAYPQFGINTAGTYLVPTVITQMYIDLADACIKEVRWHSSWQIAMGWFVAHFCTLYLQGTADPNSGAGAVLEAGKAKGLDTSIGAGDVSVSTDYSLIANGLDGWVMWKSTIYGQQIITIGRLLGKAGMYIY